MPAAALVCEFNPFHYGHEYIIKEALKHGKPLICVMSGNFVQRGTAAVMEKYARAECAVLAGASLVVELPTVYACANAQSFARGAINLIRSLAIVDELIFGSECGDLAMLQKCADRLNDGGFGEEIRARLSDGVTFAAARSQAAGEEFSEILKNPNDILALEYLEALKNSGITPRAVKRTQTPGATEARECIFTGKSFSFPPYVMEIIKRETALGKFPVATESLDTAIMAKLRSMTRDDYARLPDVSEGLENRLYEAAKISVTFEGACDAAKTKRYTRARLRRLYMNAFLGIEKNEKVPAYAKILAFNDSGRKFIKEIKNIPVITKPAAYKDLLEREAYFTDLFSLAYPGISMRAAGNELRSSAKYIVDCRSPIF